MEPNAKSRCECGRAKPTDVDACDRCAYLDGNRLSVARVIHLLRIEAGLVPIGRITEQLGTTRRHVNNVLRTLLETGRVTRFQAGHDSPAFFALTNGRRKKTMPKTQTEIPGTERPSIDAIDDAACDYVEKRDERMQLTKDEKAAKGHLQAVMEANAKDLDRDKDGALVYAFYDGERELEAKCKTTVDVSVRVKKAPEEGDGGEVVDMDGKKIG